MAYQIPEHGLVVIDKPTGMTSFGVVARIRRVLSRQMGKKVKVGHTGTLDPFASGVMLLVTGAECKNAAQYSKLDKIYEAIFYLGAHSTTGDPEGQIIYEEAPLVPNKITVQAALKKFEGQITQRPPIFSAIKIAGKRAYQLARDGKEVEIPERTVTVHSLELLSYQYPLLKVRAHVSSGTYIRSLAVDVAKTLGSTAYCTELRRISVAEWNLEQAATLADFGIDS
ncbi:tRNA pseudouridine(55) synthase TruB [Candidatus Saccharibacteria bacterium]|nr:tRNA pseudouridine(55) synthase TruB [Candidatus Saccharibacteria bacterium]